VEELQFIEKPGFNTPPLAAFKSIINHCWYTLIPRCLRRG